MFWRRIQCSMWLPDGRKNKLRKWADRNGEAFEGPEQIPSDARGSACLGQPRLLQIRDDPDDLVGSGRDAATPLPPSAFARPVPAGAAGAAGAASQAMSALFQFLVPEHVLPEQ